MKPDRRHAGWALKLWVLASVFLIPFVGLVELAGWLGIGAALGLLWRALPEAPPEAPAGKLPFHDQYADRQVPRPGDPE